ncbi:MAG: Na/Pi cotransporter family protein [Candidatus Margulisiibacteriota bacterium]|nr:Na/Pi cotransporter family protein [Candidatus Margulisiibacteriota bacterium]
MQIPLAFGLVGGLGLFLLGMKIMSEGLQKIAGKNLRKVLEFLTKNTFMGVFVGAGVTAIVQSSSATTIMLIGFIQAGLMTLKQSIGIIYGANIGTTVTAQIIAFKIHKYALLAIGVGVFLNFFVPRKQWKYFGQVLLGFGLLFFGLQVMTSVFVPLKSSPEFKEIFLTFGKNPILAVLTGAVMTMVVQSSSATTGVILVLAGVGLIDFKIGFALILGTNIGTTVTAQLAAINANIAAKRTAWAHTLFNVLGSVYMLALLKVKIAGQPAFLYFIDLITPGNAFAGQNLERHLANTHTVFNVVNCLVFLPLTGILAFVVSKIVRGEVETVEHGTKFLDDRMLVTPDIAIGQAKKEITRMGVYSQQMLRLSFDSIFDSKENVRQKKFDSIRQRERVVNELEKDISSFLIRLDQKSLTEDQSKTSAGFLHLIHDIERIGDISENIMDLVEMKSEENVPFTEMAQKELRTLFKEVEDAVSSSLMAFEKWDKDTALKALEIEGKVDAIEQDYRDNHIRRLNKGECSSTAGVIFLDVLSNLERAGDHANNIARKVLEINAFSE